jgi:hypothetical protein
MNIRCRLPVPAPELGNLTDRPGRANALGATNVSNSTWSRSVLNPLLRLQLNPRSSPLYYYWVIAMHDAILCAPKEIDIGGGVRDESSARRR